MELEVVQKIANDFFEKMLITLDSLEVIQEEENIFYIKVKTSESSLMIGYSGKNLEDIRTILKGILSKINGKNVVLHLEVNDYLSKKEDKLLDAFVKEVIRLAEEKEENRENYRFSKITLDFPAI